MAKRNFSLATIKSFMNNPPVLSFHSKNCTYARALDKREYFDEIRDNFYLFCIKTYVLTPHLNRSDDEPLPLQISPESNY